MRGVLEVVVIWGIVQAACIQSFECGHSSQSGTCSETGDGYEGGEIFDITHQFTPNTPVGESSEGIGPFLKLLLSMKNGSDYNFSEMKIPVHSGTHVDAPGHMYDNYFDQGYDVDTLDLRVLNGHALLVDVPRDKNITAEVMKSLNIPKGVRRVLFRTLNTDRGLMYKKAFDSKLCGVHERWSTVARRQHRHQSSGTGLLVGCCFRRCNSFSSGFSGRKGNNPSGRAET